MLIFDAARFILSVLDYLCTNLLLGMNLTLLRLTYCLTFKCEGFIKMENKSAPIKLLFDAHGLMPIKFLFDAHGLMPRKCLFDVHSCVLKPYQMRIKNAKKMQLENAH